jgi:hypothetical protein
MAEEMAHDWREICKLILDEDRLRVLGVLAVQAGSAREVASKLEMKEQLAARHTAKLAEAGLLKVVGTSHYVLNLDTLQAWKRELFAGAAQATEAVTPEAKVLASFVEGDQLKSIPASQSKRLVVLAWLAGMFQPGVDYPEREVNEILRRHYADYASLRRYLVDAGLMQRESGIYRRTAATPAAPGQASGLAGEPGDLP